MLDDIRRRGGLNIVGDSEVTCGSVPHCIPAYSGGCRVRATPKQQRENDS